MGRGARVSAACVAVVMAGHVSGALGVRACPSRWGDGSGRRVVVGGQPVGLVLCTRHWTVSALLPVPGAQNQPWRAFRVGDTVVAVDGGPVARLEDLAHKVQEAGRAGRRLRVRVVRAGHRRELRLQPVWDAAAGRWRLGLALTRTVQGIGTLTYYDPGRGTFAALGHRVTGPQGDEVAVEGGVVVPALVTRVMRARPGVPGAKLGRICPDRLVGVVAANTRAGVVGWTAGTPLLGPRVPVEPAQAVHPGPALVLTALQGQKVEAFAAWIERVVRGDRGQNRGFRLRLVDARLLRHAGGIVQGMSGSPVLQDGCLAGAVTHVQVRDPRRGYGVLASQMLLMSDAWAKAASDRRRAANLAPWFPPGWRTGAHGFPADWAGTGLRASKEGTTSTSLRVEGRDDYRDTHSSATGRRQPGVL